MLQDKNNSLKLLKILIININFIAIFFITIFIYITTNRITEGFMAREFINKVSALPGNPSKILIQSGLLFLLLIISFILREFIFTNSTKVLYSTVIVDFLCSIWIIYLLNFNYNGILFLVMANVITYTKGNRWRYLLMVFTLICILIADYDLISMSFRLYSLEDYFSIYDSLSQQYLKGFYNIVSSVNIAVFILYCITLIQSQRGTIHEVQALYDKLTISNEELQIANEQLKQYSAITEKMGETRERNRLAREIHDTLGHTLTGIAAGIDACITIVDKSPEDTKKQLEIISEVTRQGIKDVRRSVNKLRPDALERLSLESAINNMIREIEAVAGAHIVFNWESNRFKFGPDEEDTIYRIIQESLTNAIRHGKATEIWVQISEKDEEITLIIKDNGIGCKTIKKGFGIRHIAERVELLKGRVWFEGSKGFTVTAKIPIRQG
ncbi:sensor histidine kinase [Alloiococcus sp. CFN-8]|uniref:sensor histidine kinase n=1 Tax=Alloiococcus sp. CFN-8 TaxID=3416081 RepID=UPI003CF76FF8